MHGEELQVRRTLLTESPRRHSALVASLSFAVLSLTTLTYWENHLGLAAELPAVPSRVFQQGEWWRLFTAMGIHSGGEHYLANVGPFTLLAFLLFGYYGPLVFPLGILLLGALVNGLSLFTYASDVRLMGASGLVYLMGAFWLTLFILVDRRHHLRGRLLRASGFVLVFFVPSTIEAHVSYRTHGIGFAVGTLFGLLYFAAHRKRIRSREVRMADELPPWAPEAGDS